MYRLVRVFVFLGLLAGHSPAGAMHYFPDGTIFLTNVAGSRPPEFNVYRLEVGGQFSKVFSFVSAKYVTNTPLFLGGGMRPPVLIDGDPGTGAVTMYSAVSNLTVQSPINHVEGHAYYSSEEVLLWDAQNRTASTFNVFTGMQGAYSRQLNDPSYGSFVRMERITADTIAYLFRNTLVLDFNGALTEVSLKNVQQFDDYNGVKLTIESGDDFIGTQDGFWVALNTRDNVLHSEKHLAFIPMLTILSGPIQVQAAHRIPKSSHLQLLDMDSSLVGLRFGLGGELKTVDAPNGTFKTHGHYQLTSSTFHAHVAMGRIPATEDLLAVDWPRTGFTWLPAVGLPSAGPGSAGLGVTMPLASPSAFTAAGRKARTQARGLAGAVSGPLAPLVVERRAKGSPSSAADPKAVATEALDRAWRAWAHGPWQGQAIPENIPGGILASVLAVPDARPMHSWLDAVHGKVQAEFGLGLRTGGSDWILTNISTQVPRTRLIELLVEGMTTCQANLSAAAANPTN